MKMYGLIGYPLTHSFSRQYFTGKFEKEGITDSVFHNFPITSIDEFPGLLKENPGLRGLNVTIPYKEQVLKYVTGLSKEVEDTGAANCISIRGDKRVAYNTDITGFREAFIKKLGTQSKALVLGSGGSSKAIRYVLEELGIEYLVVSRSGETKEKYISYEKLSKDILEAYTILVNCTPLGMSPRPEFSPPIPYQFLTPKHYLFDLVYNPVRTQFLKKGEEYGAVTENGLDMLVLQAEASWRIWNDAGY